MNTIIKDYKKLILECDVTHKDFRYDEMDLCWYDYTEIKESITYRYHNYFSLISHESLDRLKTRLTDSKNQEWMLNTVSLKEIYEVMGNPIVLLSSFLCADFNNKVTVVKVIDNESYQRVLRRLTIKYFEEIKDELHNAKNTDNFFDYTEEQLLHGDIIKQFRDEVLNLNENIPKKTNLKFKK